MKYSLLDSGNFKKYEQLGPYRIIRPSASAPWAPYNDEKKWEADAIFTRSKGKGDQSGRVDKN